MASRFPHDEPVDLCPADEAVWQSIRQRRIQKFEGRYSATASNYTIDHFQDAVLMLQARNYRQRSGRDCFLSFIHEGRVIDVGGALERFTGLDELDEFF